MVTFIRHLLGLKVKASCLWMALALDLKRELAMERLKTILVRGLVTGVKVERQTQDKVGLPTILFTIHVCMAVGEAMDRESVVLEEDPSSGSLEREFRSMGFCPQRV